MKSLRFIELSLSIPFDLVVDDHGMQGAERTRTFDPVASEHAQGAREGIGTRGRGGVDADDPVPADPDPRACVENV